MVDQREEENPQEQGDDFRIEMEEIAAQQGTSKRRGRPSQRTEEQKREMKRNTDRNYRKNKKAKFGMLEDENKEMIKQLEEASEMVQKLKDNMKAKEATIEGQQNELNAAKATIEALQNEKKSKEATIEALQEELSSRKMRAEIKRLEKRVEKERAQTEKSKAEFEELMIVVERKVVEFRLRMVKRDDALDEFMLLTKIESVLPMEEVLLSHSPQQPGDEEDGQMMLGIPEPDVTVLTPEFGIQSSPTSSWDEYINSAFRTPSPPVLDNAKGPTTDEGQKLDAAFPKDI